jgi:GGDEF domain-containing protein
MVAAIQRDLLSELSNAVAAYLNVMGASADCLERTYPDVGGIYRQRIERLRSRVAYHATREAIHDSAEVLEAELRDYADVANRALTQRSVELSRGILALGDILEDFAKRQDSYGDRLWQLARQLETGPNSAEASKTIAAHAANLRTLVEGMSKEGASAIARMRAQMAEMDQRLAGAASVDPLTGLINRREMERRIEVLRAHGSVFTLIRFELSGLVGDQLLKMAADRLTSNFRHPDWIARWGDKEFAVLLMAEPAIAEARAEEVIPYIQGPYILESGAMVDIVAKLHLPQPELAVSK